MATELQNKSNHVRIDPGFHYTLLPALVMLLIAAVVQVVRFPNLTNGELAILIALVLFASLKARLYALKVQDRVIRLEERLRLAFLTDAPDAERFAGLTESQLIALRFASDAELPSLAGRALQNKLDAKQIKEAIQNWRGDYWRV